MDAEVLSVSDAIKLVNGKLKALAHITITGEVIGFRGPHARSGHCYFDIKDEAGKLSVAVWKGIYQACGFELQDGMQLEITGHFDVYPKGGSLSFIAEKLTIAGEGLLLQQIEELKRKLAAEGLFDESRKTRPKAFCERVICVTSLSGEVKDDVLQNINPLVDIAFVGCRVEGKDAPQEIIKALAIAESHRPDAILLVRGGGSLESLMTFNDEALCRAVAACTVPVVSGVGHEPDVTICDFVADLRCSTPTAAAKSVAPDFATVVATINDRESRLVGTFTSMLDGQESALEHQADLLHRAMDGQLAEARFKVESYSSRACLLSPTYLVDDRRETLMQDEQRFMDAWPRYASLLTTNTQHLSQRLNTQGQRIVKPYADHMSRLAATLDALSPLKVLGRGYAITSDATGHVIRSSQELQPGQEVQVRLNSGSFNAEVTQVSTQ